MTGILDVDMPKKKYSPLYYQVRDEILAHESGNGITYKQRLMLEQQIFRSLVASEGKCARCPQTHYLTLDHIVPREILRCFNVDVDREIIEGNYQLLCRACNSLKSGRLDFAVPETKPILIKLLERV